MNKRIIGIVILIALIALAAFICVTSFHITQKVECDNKTTIETRKETIPEILIINDDAGLSENSITKQYESCDLEGVWYLQDENNDLNKFVDLFPGYPEWDAAMEIRADGKIYWYIGAIGGNGIFTLNNNILTAELKHAIKDETSEPQDWIMDFTVMEDDGNITLEMMYGDERIVWRKGNVPVISIAEEWKSEFEMSLLEQYGVVPEYYEHLRDGIYQVYVEIDGKTVPYVTVDSATGDYHG